MSANIPGGYQTVMPYLIMENAAAFIEFTQKVFNAELLGKHMSGETAIMHAEIKIGTSVIMFADSTGQYPPMPAGLFIYVDDADKTYNSALDNGATAVTAMADQSYGRSGGVKDIFGNVWWITSLI
ncbi:MAG TPA: VOC family protein [Parafilimonas sp.]|nr:VOC family protein [Parafilimonas sp.]